MNIFFEFTDLVEPLSLDEAYLDVTTNKKGINSATIIAREIKNRIRSELKLTASAGVSVNKFLAKVASEMDKPNGLYVIPPEKAEAFIEGLDVKKVPGIGKVTSAKMNEFGIKSCADLKKFEKIDLVKKFGKSGNYYYNIVHGEYDSPVRPHRIRKSISAERTFDKDISNPELMIAKLESITKNVVDYISKRKIKGKTVTLKIKYFDFVNRTRSKTVGSYIDSYEEIFSVVKELLYNPALPEKAVRLLGVGLSNLNINETQTQETQFTLGF